MPVWAVVSGQACTPCTLPLPNERLEFCLCESSPTAEQMPCTSSASVRILPVCLGHVREQRLALSAYPSPSVMQLYKLRRSAHGGLSLPEGCVYLARR
jgi:hypothetical protein